MINYELSNMPCFLEAYTFEKKSRYTLDSIDMNWKPILDEK